ncbi:KAT8 regulatory NSL complex subunit 3-like isoform X2 [Littorina saxatilis]|uniref:KAT8 regulatory NSL complex subunit 3-like isoform X2 n=1 Tax=Littorina saxatilis TaxID=31220 RepID=UPI0038B577C6
MAQQETISSIRHRFSASTSSFLTQFGGGWSGPGGAEQEMDVIMLDHGYAKPWSAHPDASNARPVRMLFMPKQTRSSTLDTLQGEPPIDVVDVPPAPSMPFDINKARNLMTECERHASYARPDNQEDWEEKISKQGWTIQQNRAFTKVIKALQADRLARLAMDSVPNEPIARRQLVDKTAKRLRQALASVGWDMNVVQWLHQLILDMVSIHLLASYLDALQTLKSKVPTLVEKMVSGAPPKHPSLSQESLGLLLKRPWDPVNSVLMQHKLRKLPNNPLLLLAPSGPTQGSSSMSGQAKRLKFWQAHLNTLGKTITVNMSGGSGVSTVLCLEQMIGALRTKVLEQKSHIQNRPIVLVGWNVGALVACHVSLVESVSAVVCLGFPFTGIHGPRGDCEDPLLASQTPTLFVIGQDSSDGSIDQLQDLREHMRAETGMLVVGGADEQLRLSHRKKREEGLTQAMADRWIIEEVNQFLGSILSMNAGSPEHPLPEVTQTQIDPRRKRKRKVAELIGATDSNLPATLGLLGSEAAMLGSGTGRVSKRGGKAARQMAERGRGGPKKRQCRGGMGGGARKRMALGMGQLGARGAGSSGGLHAATTATLSAVTTAPELYGLLQGIPISRAKEGDSVLLGTGRSLMSIPRTKLLAFSKLKEEGGEGSGAGSGTMSATVLASALRSSGEMGDKDKLSQQILVRTGGPAGTPITIPISMAPRLVAGGVGVSSPLVHITGASSSSHIHQLLSTSMARAAGTITTTATGHQPALLINTMASASTPVSGSAEKEAPKRAEQLDKIGAQKPKPEKMDVNAGQDGKEGGRDLVLASIQSSQYHDFPLTTASLTNPASVLTQTSLTSPQTQAPLYTTSPAVVFSQAPLPTPATVLIQTKAGDGQSASPSPSSSSSLAKPTMMQLAVSKSLINSASIAGSSILGKVVAGSVTQAGQTGSPIATSSILGGRSAVLISTTMAKCLTSASSATLLSKAGGEGGSSSTSYVVNREMLGKVSSVLESAPNVRHTTQPSGGTSLVTGPFSVAKGSVINALAVAKSQASFPATNIPSTTTSVPAVTTSASTPSASAGSTSGSGRGGHRSATSVSYSSNAKPVLPTVASTRTRRIRIPKQYDL